ncbi:MAG: class I SAM-dependent methyltransferase [Tepidisphaeraceae bacterium]
MADLPSPIVAACVPCKCCGGEARLFGVVDFHKNCANAERFKEPSGIPIYYHRCQHCGFLFTVAFDAFSLGDFSRWIYNQDYALVDPGYELERPKDNARYIGELFDSSRNIRILDYGGGNGKLAELLRAGGFATVDTYDPLVAQFAARPADRYDVVVAIEVAEHTPQPLQTFGDMVQFMKPEGMILFSTTVLPAIFDHIGVQFWYVAPRNGHVSIYSRQSLIHIVTKLGLQYVRGAESEFWHAIWRQPPPFARHLVHPPNAAGSGA